MTITADRINVDAAPAEPTQLSGSDAGRSGSGLVVKNRGSASVDLGGEDVAGGAGFELAAGETVTVPLERGEELFAIKSAAGDPVRLDVLAVGG